MDKSSIVIVDDHDIFRKGLKAVLEQYEPFSVTAEYADGKEFLEALETIEPDIVLMDINMPVMDGIESSKKSLEKKPELKILILSMYDDAKYYESLINSGVKGFILKDAKFSELKTAITRILDGETYFSQELLVKLLQQQNEASHIKLTQREQQVLNLLAKGATTAEISEHLDISFRTVERHRANLLSKTGTQNSLQLIVFAIKNNMVSV
jgi:DNA-binding NarL/FixJ family response regulator